MIIAYFEPLSCAWKRMTKALFNPFNLNKWFIIGFNAFLAGLLNGPHGNISGKGRGDDISFREFLDFPNRAWVWLMDNPGWFVAIMFIVMLLFILGIVLTWLSSRGKLMFLDNVVHNRAEIAAPWKQYNKEGNSLFVWRFCFGLIVFAFFILLIFIFFTAASALYVTNRFTRTLILFIVGWACLFLLTIVVSGYISIFLDSFVVPIMYKHNLTATQAWGRFLSLFNRHPFHFLLFGLFVFVLMIGFVIGVILAGFMTCCIGFILLIIPYIGTVVTLPIWYTLRAFSLEYLRQFGAEYDIFPAPQSEAIPATT
jgi:MFS family permease